MTYFFSYDIVNVRIRNLISKKLKQFGIRVQKSVFQCDISSEKADELKTTLLAIFKEKEDSLLFYHVCGDCLEKAHLIGEKTFLQDEGFKIL